MVLGQKLSALSLFTLLIPFQGCKPRNFNTETQASFENAKERWLVPWKDEKEMKTWYLTPQGSFVIPMDIYLNLETKNGGSLFSSKENLKQFGWVYPPRQDEGEYNRHGLPLGFVEEPDPKNDNRMTMGFTCAACHTGEFRAGNTRVVVDGSQPLVDLDRYSAAFLEALRETKKPERLTSLHERIKKWNPKSPYARNKQLLEEDLKERLTYFTERMRRNSPKLAGGHGRLDAVAQILNEVLVDHAQLNERDARGNYLNARPPAAPISFPPMWNVADLECVQTNCLARNPLTRNLGEVLGVYGRIQLRAINKDGKVDLNDLKTLSTAPQLFDISANPHNLHRLEESVKKMPLPQWPSDLYGPLNSKLVESGKAVFERKQFSDGSGQSVACVSCHVHTAKSVEESPAESRTKPNKFGKQFYVVQRLSPQVTKTDSAFLEEHGARTIATPLPPHLAGLYDMLVNKNEPFFDRFDPSEKKLALKFLGLVNLVAIRKWFTANGFDDKKKAEYSSYQEQSTDFNAGVYKARPLTGIAFSAPYLHNGSVPSLHELLKKPEDRVKTFPTGTLQWDSKTVGFSIAENATYDYGKLTFDTSIRGNRNSGHEWGTELSSDDKIALIEYLKSL